jgi:hypothetical protein
MIASSAGNGQKRPAALQRTHEMTLTVEIFDTFTRFEKQCLDKVGLPSNQASFLSDVGLPSWCAPNMCFGNVVETTTQLPIVEVNGALFAVLGEDRDENFIVIDLQRHMVWVMPQTPVVGEPVFMAADVIELSDALYRFQICINIAVERDSEAFTENRIPLESLSPFIDWMQEVAPNAIAPGAFWYGVVSWLGFSLRESDEESSK